jgi:hypothetical protein
MMWPLSPATVTVVAAVTLGVSFLADVRARRVRALTHGAALSGNRSAVAATERRARRVWRQHCTYALPTVAIGMALLTTHAVACLAVALPR